VNGPVIERQILDAVTAGRYADAAPLVSRFCAHVPQTSVQVGETLEFLERLRRLALAGRANLAAHLGHLGPSVAAYQHAAPRRTFEMRG